jgi:hypothetical protein
MIPGHRVLIEMPYLPVAQITIAGFPLAFVLGGITIITLVAAATLGMLLQKEGYDIPFGWHVNLARLTVVLALLHGLVVYLTFF